jgi:hypothetical protein
VSAPQRARDVFALEGDRWQTAGSGQSRNGSMAGTCGRFSPVSNTKLIYFTSNPKGVLNKRLNVLRNSWM